MLAEGKLIHKVTSIQYKNARFFNKCILVGKIWPWWEFCKFNPRYVRKCYLILRLITGNSKITERLHTPNASRFCQDCDLMESDNVEHMLFYCTKTVSLTRHLWRTVLLEAPAALSK